MAEITLKSAKRHVTSIPKSKIRAAVRSVFAKYRVSETKTTNQKVINQIP
jgi:hypothetical protein